MSLSFESVFSLSKDDGDELKRPTRSTPRQPKHNTPEDGTESAAPTSGENGDGIPRLEDLFHAPSWLPGAIVTFFILAGMAALAMHVARSNRLATA